MVQIKILSVISFRKFNFFANWVNFGQKVKKKKKFYTNLTKLQRCNLLRKTRTQNFNLKLVVLSPFGQLILMPQVPGQLMIKLDQIWSIF